MRAGRPWKATRSRAMRIQRRRRVVLGEELEDGLVGGADVGRIAGERHPAERALALAEQRPDVGRHEAGEVEGVLDAALRRLAAEVVAVVEGRPRRAAGARASRARASAIESIERRT